MSKRVEKIRLKRLNEERVAKGQPAIVRSVPKPKPLDISSAAAPKQAFFRPREIHPLDKLKAKLSEVEFDAGRLYRALYESLEHAGIDCTALFGAGRGGTNGMELRMAAQQDSYNALTRIKARLPEWEHEIIRKICGEAWPAFAAVREHWISNGDDTLNVVRNSLNHLASVIPHARVPYRVHKLAYEQRAESLAFAS